MAKHKPTVVWPTRPLGTYPQQYVQTVDERTVEVQFFNHPHGDGVGIRLSRLDARLLARRLNQCLDDTRS